MNVLLISHCNFRGNSSLHAFSLARALKAQGLHPAICVPDHPETVFEIGEPDFPVLDYADALRGDLSFDNAGPADLVHAFTPREGVRRITQSISARHRCPWVVHLEDHEQVIASDALGGLDYASLAALPATHLDRLIGQSLMHPVHGAQFIHGAGGISALIEPLLSYRPAHVPAQVFWPGYDEAYLRIDEDRLSARQRLGLSGGPTWITYTGNVHRSNLVEFRSLLLAVGLLRRRGRAVRLLRTGQDHVDMSWAERAGLLEGVTQLGFQPRASMPDLLAAADILVQPGESNPFNNLRFPSKLPEFLASGRPTILPAANIGNHLVNGEQALILRHGDAHDIADNIARLMDNPALAARIGQGGRDFAVRCLDWRHGARKLLGLYEQVRASASRPSIAARSSAAVARVSASIAPSSMTALPLALMPMVMMPMDWLDADPVAWAHRVNCWHRHGIRGLCLSLADGQVSPDPGDTIHRLMMSAEPSMRFCLSLPGPAAQPSTVTGNPSSRVAQSLDDTALVALLRHPRYLSLNDRPVLVVDTIGQAPRASWPDLRVHRVLHSPTDSLRQADDSIDALMQSADRPEPAGPLFSLPAYPLARPKSPTSVPSGQMTLIGEVHRAVITALARAPIQYPLVFIDGGPGNDEPGWLATVARELVAGYLDYHRAADIPVPAGQARTTLAIDRSVNIERP